MTAPVSVGSDVKVARNGFIKAGRLIVAPGPYWSRDQAAGFPGYDGPAGPPNTTFQADSDALCDAMMRWLAGKAFGSLNVLVCQYDPPTTSEFGDQFCDGIVRNGHTLTLTDDPGGWDGFEPLDYDLVVSPAALGAFTYHGLTVSADKIDYVLTHGGAMLSTEQSGNRWERYGMHFVGYHTSHVPGRIPFHCSAIGSSLYYLVEFGTVYGTEGTLTMGGTRTVYYCDTHTAQGALSLWSSQ